MAEPAPYLSGERLRALLPPAEALAAVQRFFARHRREAVVVPPRIHLPVPGRDTIGLYMPAATRDFVGLKSVHLMPSRFPSVEAEVFLYDAETGRLLFWGDGKPMTALRTAAVSTAATRRLLDSCRTLVVYGAGVQAAAHVAAFAAAYPELETVWAVTRSPASFARLQQALPADLRARLRPCADPAPALAAADCVVTTTPAPRPLFAWDALGPRCHVVGIGSATHAMNELPPEAFLEGRAWLDTRGAIEEAGDLRAAVARGWSEARLGGDLFDLLGPDARPTLDSGGGPGRTVFKSVGHAAQDLAVLIHLWQRLQADGA
jgi:ornithine cyclodeaminase/alanine dehydrogenase-like protein (mu-crystallin family)